MRRLCIMFLVLLCACEDSENTQQVKDTLGVSLVTSGIVRDTVYATGYDLLEVEVESNDLCLGCKVYMSLGREPSQVLSAASQDVLLTITDPSDTIPVIFSPDPVSGEEFGDIVILFRGVKY